MNFRIKNGLTLILLSMIIILGGSFLSPLKGKNMKNKLWYDKPASEWNEALPVGNGFLGAMVFGDPGAEQLQLNETTVWAGSPYNNLSNSGLEHVSEIRRLIFEKKHAEAQKLAWDTMMGPQQGMPFQPVGDLFLKFENHENYSDYRRELDLSQAINAVEYTVDGIRFRRELFASISDRVIVMKITADQPGKVSFSMDFSSEQEHSVSFTHPDCMEFSGRTSDFEGIEGKVRFAGMVEVRQKGGKFLSGEQAVILKEADTAEIRLSIGTNFVNFRDISADPELRAKSNLQVLEDKTYTQLVKSHISAYKGYFDRVSIELGDGDESTKPTDLRLAEFRQTEDPDLVELYFQFGRYLLISCSQPGGQPATLQGIWNPLMTPPWDSKYTVNINTEMNYWPAEVTNLAEMHEPLIAMVRDLSITGQEAAEQLYGVDGWVVHHNTDIWRVTGPVDGAFWGLWPMGGAWLTQHLWEKYLYSGDLDYLQSVYPVMRGCALFFNETLVEEPINGWLVVSPSISPENAPSIRPDVSIAAGCSMDTELVFELFSFTIRASELLGIDEDFRSELKNKKERLAPLRVGRFGQLQEWLEDLDNPEDRHRHVSHLFALHPGRMISPFRNPELFDAARISLEHRGDESTGWSMGWKVNFWARLMDGNRALRLISRQLSPARYESSDGWNTKGGTYPNLFDAHPPFQIDGNFGCTAGIAEMLMQSHDGAIYLLPALPDKWASGQVSGLRARGGFTLDFAWQDSRLTNLRIKSETGGNCRIRLTNSLRNVPDDFKPVTGENNNPCYWIPRIKEPCISSKAPSMAHVCPTVFEYDITFGKGEIKNYTLNYQSNY